MSGASNAELRSLTVENTGGASYATAIYNNGSHLPACCTSPPSLRAGPHSNDGVSNNGSPKMTNVTAAASGGSESFGVVNSGSTSSTKMTNVTATASGGSTSNVGVWNRAYSSPTMTNVTAAASSGTNSYGVWNELSFDHHDERGSFCLLWSV